MDRTIGTCSWCGGRVTVPEHWMGMSPPIPTCENCGAKAKHPWGPAIEMEPPRQKPLAPEGEGRE